MRAERNKFLYATSAISLDIDVCDDINAIVVEARCRRGSPKSKKVETRDAASAVQRDPCVDRRR